MGRDERVKRSGSSVRLSATRCRQKIRHDLRNVDGVAGFTKDHRRVRQARLRIDARHDDHRDIARHGVVRQIVQHGVTAHGGKIQVEQEQGRSLLFNRPQRAKSVVGGSAVDTAQRERSTVKTGKLGIVLHNEDTRARRDHRGVS